MRPGSGGPRYEGVQRADWPDDIFWKPDGVADSSLEPFRRWWPFGDHPGPFDRVMTEFTAAGLRMPWLACFGKSTRRSTRA
jgi:hypothetical protein